MLDPRSYAVELKWDIKSHTKLPRCASDHGLKIYDNISVEFDATCRQSHSTLVWDGCLNCYI